jgi:chromosome segregation protein
MPDQLGGINMRIKRLEIQGFKSFKDKTIIYFDRPITGIVGPNGSGKSNIVDAFFWVMGEQSYKHIRSSGSDDIIFKGSSKYAPLGMAEATLVMEQDEVEIEAELYEHDPATAPMGASVVDSAPKNKTPTKTGKTKEISVTRRVYRDGDGEYFINGVQARLKDIQELFLDTGVGAKGYSVIEQGQIDKVVNSKPEDRRLLIEDAAGIAKYKARKKESLRKLEGAHANLLRLNDVIAEIERSLSALERQAQKARRYKEYRSELLEKETTWGRRKNQVLNRQLDQVQKNRVLFEADLVGLRAELSTCENDLESSRVVQLTDSKIQEQLQSEIEAGSSELNHHQSALALSKQRQEDLNRQLVQLQNEKSQIEDELQNYRESISTKAEDFSGIDERVLALSEQVSVIEQKVQELRTIQDSNKNEAETKRREFVSLTQQSAQSDSKIAALHERIQGSESQLAQIQSIQSEAQQDLTDAMELKISTEENLATKNTERSEIKISLETKRSSQLTAIEELKKSRSQFDQALKNLTTSSSRLKSLEGLEAAREGMADGPKKLLEWANQNGNSFAVLSDFIEVEGGFDTSVEAVLGHAFERLYAQDADTAFQALQYLKESAQGSASIQIAVPQLSAVERAVHHPLRKYIRLINPDGYTSENSKAVHQLIECLVASVEVLEEVPAMGDIKTYQSEGISFVTKNGIWFDASQGVLFGGSAESDQASSILARKRIIQDLKIEVTVAEVRYAELNEQVDSQTAACDALQAEVKSLESKFSELGLQVSALEGELNQLSRRISDAEKAQQRVTDQQQNLEQQVIDAREQITEIEASIAGIVEARALLQTWIQCHEAEHSDKDANLRSVEQEYQSLKIQEASEKERKNSLKKELEAEQRYLQDRERRLSEVDRLLETFAEDRAQFSGGDEEHAETVERLTRSLSAQREELSIVRDRLEQANVQVNLRLGRIKKLHKDAEEKSSEMNQFAIDLERYQAELNHLVSNMEEKYGAGCLDSSQAVEIQEEMTDPVVTVEMSEEQERVLHEDVESLRDRIRRLGEVNTLAVEEYDEMQKRYEHLRNEKNDLEQSIQNLNDAIEHINQTSIERFNKAFVAIAERFEKLFPIIFGGGMAKLSLVYPEGSTDILDAGVDILAQPPGKKISNMTLLSGGEKALTAISMIFAIFMVKPSPFCILDEVDAPLDDSNIGKFNALVREMSVKSQFILVTHNKKTMELNDTLYGVTMEEPGVSRMISIQLQ